MGELPDGWDLPSPYLLSLAVEDADIDAYRHVNNAVYVTWFDRVAWNHSAVLGLPMASCLELDRGMAVVRSVIVYLRPALREDRLVMATWLLPGEGKLRVRRRFQLRRVDDGMTLVRAEIEYACIELSSGRPSRWPPAFRECYVPEPSVLEAARGLASI